MKRLPRPLQALVVSGVLVLLPHIAWAIEPAIKCEAKKLKAAGKYSDCRFKATAKSVTKGGVAEFSKCDAKFNAKWTAAENGPACSTTGDAARVFDHIVFITDDLVLVLDGPRFVDHGNGTVTDTSTGLMWEKKSGTEVDGVINYGDPHDPDNYYQWSSSGSAPDGSVFTDFLGRLNDCGTSDGNNITGGFAGHCDWRIPTSAELQTILAAPYNCINPHPCIDPIFGTTAAAVHYSSTTHSDIATHVWFVGFYDGLVQESAKGGFAWVRAVRREPPVATLD